VKRFLSCYCRILILQKRFRVSTIYLADNKPTETQPKSREVAGKIIEPREVNTDAETVKKEQT
jgi:hypothetical protein